MDITLIALIAESYDCLKGIYDQIWLKTTEQRVDRQARPKTQLHDEKRDMIADLLTV